MGAITKIKDTVTIISIVATLGLGYWGSLMKQEANRANRNLHSTTIEYKDKLGRNVTETTELRFTIKELRNVNKKYKQDSTSIVNEYEKKLLKVANQAKALDIKLRDVENAFIGDLSVSNDSMISEIVYNEDRSLNGLKPIKTKHLSIDFKVDGDKMIVNHKYNTDLSIIGHRQRDKETVTGKSRFFLARWVNPRWKYKASAVAEDKDASFKITNIKFQRGKGGRS